MSSRAFRRLQKDVEVINVCRRGGGEEEEEGEDKEEESPGFASQQKKKKQASSNLFALVCLGSHENSDNVTLPDCVYTILVFKGYDNQQ